MQNMDKRARSAKGKVIKKLARLKNNKKPSPETMKSIGQELSTLFEYAETSEMRLFVVSSLQKIGVLEVVESEASMGDIRDAISKAILSIPAKPGDSILQKKKDHRYSWRTQPRASRDKRKDYFDDFGMMLEVMVRMCFKNNGVNPETWENLENLNGKSVVYDNLDSRNEKDPLRLIIIVYKLWEGELIETYLDIKKSVKSTHSRTTKSTQSRNCRIYLGSRKVATNEEVFSYRIGPDLVGNYKGLFVDSDIEYLWTPNSINLLSKNKKKAMNSLSEMKGEEFADSIMRVEELPESILNIFTRYGGSKKTSDYERLLEIYREGGMSSHSRVVPRLVSMETKPKMIANPFRGKSR